MATAYTKNWSLHATLATTTVDSVTFPTGSAGNTFEITNHSASPAIYVTYGCATAASSIATPTSDTTGASDGQIEVQGGATVVVPTPIWSAPASDGSTSVTFKVIGSGNQYTVWRHI